MATEQQQVAQLTDAEARAFRAGVEALRRALLVALAGDARVEAVIRRCQPEPR